MVNSAGAKTAVGYGRMKTSSHSLLTVLRTESSDDRIEQRPKREQERLEQERLASLDPVQREIEEHLAENPGEKVDVVLCRMLEQERITDPKVRIAAALRAKSEMERQGLWRPESKRPAKDKAHKRTRFILSILEQSKD